MSGASPADTSIGLRLQRARLVAVVTLDRAEDAAPLASVLRAGGITTVELALRTPTALDALRRWRREAPDFCVGAGTVLSPAQADAAKAAGADFALAPGLDAVTVRHCASIGLPFIAGVGTASDIQTAITLGCRLLKFFPAEPLGGARGLQILAAPFAHLGVQYLALGGINAANFPDYLAMPGVIAVGGSWIAASSLVRAQAWDVIGKNAADASAALKLLTKGNS